MRVSVFAMTLVAFYSARSAYICASMALSWRRYRGEASRIDQRPTSELTCLDVLIPALEEQAVMPNTMKYYASLARQWLHLRVWVVTAAREKDTAPPGVKSTDSVCRELAATLNADLHREAFHVVCYQGAGGRRASQLNYALTQLAAHDPKAYIAVFDADARPDGRLSRHVTAAASTNPAMIQQLQLPAFETAAVRTRSPIMSGQDLYAFRRVLGIEFRRITLAQWCREPRIPSVVRILLRPMVYGIGSGLIVRRDSLDEIGRFQEPHDDLAVGHRLSLAGDQIIVLPSINVVEPYHDVASLGKAFSSVAFGNAATLVDYRFARKHPSGLHPIEQSLLLWRALADGALWAIGPALILAAITISLLTGRVGIGLVVLALLLNGIIEPIIAHRLRLRVLNTYRSPADRGAMPFHQASLVRGMCTYLLQPAITSTGPWLLGWRWIVATVNRRQISFSKTAHIGTSEGTSDG